MAKVIHQPTPAQSPGGPPRNRRLFCIKNDRLYLCPPGHQSHLDWFRHEKWIDDDDERNEKFFAHTVMGVCFLEGDEVRCFREIDLALDEEKTEQIVDVISRNLHHLRKAFGLREDAKVFLGREDDGRFIGTVEILSKKAQKAEPEIKSSTE